MMIIHFGLAFDDVVFYEEKNTMEVLYKGPKSLLLWLESELGLAGSNDDNEYLRIERFRQAILQQLENEPTAFYKTSFEADAFATANFLLQRRDESLLAGWDFSLKNNPPERLRVISEIEELVAIQGGMEQGFADRFLAVEKTLAAQALTDVQLILHDALQHYPHYWQRILKKM